MSAIEFIFEKKRDGKYDRLLVARDGRTQEVPCPKIGDIPHDMVHFAVENVMKRGGFMRRAAAGENLSFRMEASIESDQMERLVEVMQADRQSGSPPSCDLIEMYRITCDARGVEPYPLAEDGIAALRAEMDRLRVLWNATAPGSTLTLSFGKEHAS